MKEIRISASLFQEYGKGASRFANEILMYQDLIPQSKKSGDGLSYVGHNNTVALILYNNGYNVLCHFQPNSGLNTPSYYTYWVCRMPNGKNEIIITTLTKGRYEASIRVYDMGPGIPSECPIELLKAIDPIDDEDDPSGMKRRWVVLCKLNADNKGTYEALNLWKV